MISFNVKNIEFIQFFAGWDPRGVGETLPSTPCFDSLGELNALKIEADSLTPHGLEFRGNFSDPAEVDLLFSTEKAWDTFFTKVGAKCLEAVGDDLKFIGSAAAARDLVALADALEGSHTPVNYWGFSYGTRKTSTPTTNLLC